LWVYILYKNVCIGKALLCERKCNLLIIAGACQRKKERGIKMKTEYEKKIDVVKYGKWGGY
jgi:hypothetical protein